jgi:LysM repeat protein
MKLIGRSLFILLLVGLALLAMPARGTQMVVVAAPGDFDNDGVPDDLDNCPTVVNPGQIDTNKDGIGDDCSGRDGDGIFDDFDNCPHAYNPDQRNTYGGPAGDACESETGKRLTGPATKIVVFLINNTQDIHFYSAGSAKLAATSIAALQGLAAGGAGAKVTMQGEGGNRVTIVYLGGGDFSVTHEATGDSTVFHLDGVSSNGVGAATPQSSATQTSTPQTYAVRSGDTLTKIARRFGVTVNALVVANKLKNANLILVGQTLNIPAK